MKLLSRISLVVITLILTSCTGNSRTEMLNRSTNEGVANDKLTMIIENINREDEELLKAMFSKRAIDESVNFSENAKILFEFIEGEIISWEKSGGPVVFTSTEYGDIVKEVESYYYVKTEKQTYFFLINDFPEDDANGDNEGLNMLLIVLVEDKPFIIEQDNEILYSDGERIRPPGIYLPVQ